MNVLEYVRGVKTFKVSEITSTILAIQVASEGLSAGLDRITAGELSFVNQEGSWFITKTLQKTVHDSGFKVETAVDIIKSANLAVGAIVPSLLKMVNGYHEKVWDGKLLTLRQANLLNLVEHLSFWLKYSDAVMDTLLSMQLENTTAEGYLSNYDLRWINGTMPFYREMTLDLLGGANAIVKRLEQIPEVEVSESTLDALEGTAVNTTLMNKGFGIHQVTPVFWIGMLMMKIDQRRIENMRRKNERFAMKINQAFNKRNQTDDPHLERRIEVYQNEIIKNSDAIADIEKKYA